MKLSSRGVGGVTILDIEGKILLNDGDREVKEAVDRLLAEGKEQILLNLENVPYIDSAGLGEIIRCYTTIRKRGGNLKFLSPNQKLIDLLSITKLVNVFDWYRDETDAVQSFSN